MADYYCKNAGHCTRCVAPFAADATIFMVRETVMWSVIGHGDDAMALTQLETVAVCEQCLTVKEQAQKAEIKTCDGCGRHMMMKTRQWTFTACCDRCAQRARRKRNRMKTIKCTVCQTTFETTRADAKFCSGQCRQWAFRLRHR